MSLAVYRRKRDFAITPEPAGGESPAPAGGRFVVQKHAATRLHYDFRLEVGGVLKSWAVPKGFPYAPGEKHLAVQTEDHPLAYIDFEGVIPRGQYGGGTVMVWDQGTFAVHGSLPQGLAKGHLQVELQGKKLHGAWHLVRLRESEEWLLIRSGDAMRPPSKRREDESALSGKTMRQLAAGDRVWQSPAAPKARAPRRGKPEAPAPAFIEPMQARLVDAPPPGDWHYEVKFDGWRALALKGGSETRLLSRNAHDLGAKFPEIRDAVAALPVTDAIIDGEIVALDEQGRSSFQLLQAYDVGETRPPLFFYAFDLLRLDGHDLRDKPLEKRKSRLAAILPAGDAALRFSATLGHDAAALLDQVRAHGLEGLIGKRAGSGYEAGRRSGAWIKLKLHREQEVVIGGYSDPEGSRSHFGALIVGVYDAGKLLCVGKVGTGFTRRTLAMLHTQLQSRPRTACPFSNLPANRRGKWGQGITSAEMKRCHWVEPDLVAQVKFAEWTDDGRLRQPVFLGLRADKDAREVRREIPA